MSSINMYKGIIFDLDGTLVNTMGDLVVCMNLMLKHLSLPQRTEAEIQKYINYGRYEFVRGNLPEERWQDEHFIKNAVEIYCGYYDKNFAVKSRPYDGLVSFCRQMKLRGIKICVLSNKDDKHTKKIVGHYFGEDTFAEVLGATDRFPNKPSPESALHLADSMELMPSEIIFLGDSNVDMDTAVNADMYPCGVTWGYRSEAILWEHGAKKIIHDINELYDIIKEE